MGTNRSSDSVLRSYSLYYEEIYEGVHMVNHSRLVLFIENEKTTKGSSGLKELLTMTKVIIRAKYMVFLLSGKMSKI